MTLFQLWLLSWAGCALFYTIRDKSNRSHWDKSGEAIIVGLGQSVTWPLFVLMNVWILLSAYYTSKTTPSK